MIFKVELETQADTQAAATRFADCIRAAAGAGATSIEASCERLARRAFGGDATAWAPLVVALSNLLAGPSDGRPSARRELRAFVAENADLLELH